MNNYTDEQKKMIKNMGALNYPAATISSLMGLDCNVIEKELKNKESEFYKIYQSGADYANYLIDLKLFEMAQSGDIQALNKLELRKKLNSNK